MSKAAEFYFDVGSPSSYLAWTQLPALCNAANSTLVFKPMLLGGVFQATGNASPVTIPAKGKYTTIDYGRFARRYGVPLNVNPHFPINTLNLMRLVIGVQLRAPDRFLGLLDALFKALWIDCLNLNDQETTFTVLEAAGFTCEQVTSLISDPAIKEALKANTAEAIARGVFGAPTIFVGQEMFFGQDRLDFVREALS